MGKLRFKLSHVMPHAWFYKLKEVGKPSRSLTAYKASEPRKAAYASPINHKAIDLPFPAENPRRSSLVESPFAEDFAALDQVRLGELSNDCRPSIVLPHSSACCLGDAVMSFSLDEDDPHALSSAPDVKTGTVGCSVSFDVRELEKRLKDLGSQDRRKYYTSPMLLSVAVPSPMITSDIHQSGGVRTHEGDLDMQKSPSDVCANGISSNECGSILDNKSDHLMHADEKRPFRATYGYAMCRNIEESNRLSTSSSDTGFERGSSSVWERDAFSMTSDGSEAFTATCANEAESMPKSRLRFRRLRERMSPSLYATIHMDNGLSRFCERNQETGLADNDMMCNFYEDVRIADSVQEDIDHTSHEGDRALDGQDDGSGLPVCGQLCDHELCRNNHERSFTIPSPSKSMNLSSKHENSMGIGARSLSDCEGMSDSFSMQYERNNALPAQYDSGDDWRSNCTRKLSGELSYGRSKERLLSSRTSSCQPRGWIVREGEETLSNYTKFKLKQRNLPHSAAKAPSKDMYLDPGLYNNVYRGKHTFAYDYNGSSDPVTMQSTNKAPRFEQYTDGARLRRPKTSIYHIKSPHHGARGLAGQVRSRGSMPDEGPNLFKGTLRAVRGKSQDLSFESFSPSSTSGGGLTPNRGEQDQERDRSSRVFDSFAMVKCSYDPKQDFKESMVEMIMEKKLCSSHDMVELLKCFLTLNADTYHDTIVKVFTEVWSERFQNV